MTYGPISWGHFLNWGFLLSDESNLYQVDAKPANTASKRFPFCNLQKNELSMYYKWIH